MIVFRHERVSDIMPAYTRHARVALFGRRERLGFGDFCSTIADSQKWRHGVAARTCNSAHFDDGFWITSNGRK